MSSSVFKHLLWVCTFLLPLLSMASNPVPARQDIHHYLLLSADPLSARLALQALQLDAMVDVRTLDIVAQLLVESPSPTDVRSLDVLKRCAQLLAASGNPRYSAVLQTAGRKFAGSALQSAIADAIARLGSATEPGYRPGTLTLPGERNRIASLFRGHVRGSDRSLPLPRRGSMDLQQVLDTVGAPDFMSATTPLRPAQQMHEGSFGTRMKPAGIPALELLYFGRGAIILEYGRDWRAVDTVPEVPHPPMGEIADTPESAFRLMSSSSLLMKRTARQLSMRGGRLDPDLLDVMADRLWLGMYSRTGDEVDGLSILCGIIGNSRNARYRGVLEDVVRGAADRRLASHARKALQQMPATGDGVEEYQRRLLPLK